MSSFLTIASVCGKSSSSVDIYDLELNEHGFICCDNCESILICRNAWNFLYHKGNK